MDLKTSLKKQKQEILKQWRNNELSLIETAGKLVNIGYSPLQAWEIAETN